MPPNDHYKLYWRVKASNFGGSSDWSETKSFFMKSLKIQLDSGWNLISFNTNIEGKSIPAVFPGLIADKNYVTGRNKLALYDFPVFDIANIGNLTNSQAYFIYLQRADSAFIGGAQVVPQNMPIQLQAGWNIIPYLRNSSMLPATALSSILQYVKVMRTHDGGQYAPAESINTLEQGTSNAGKMIPGKGYAVYVSQACTLVYPANPDLENEVIIGSQVWAKRNLDVAYYRNGDPIPQVTDPTQWANMTTGAWCYYNNDPANGAIYGKLYNWYAVNDPRGLAPEGWHVPSDAEWTTLTTFLGGASVAGGKLKETGTTHWLSPNTGATNETGFTALPGGWRTENGSSTYLGISGDWWTTTTSSSNSAWDRYIANTLIIVDAVSILKNEGLSIRLIKD